MHRGLTGTGHCLVWNHACPHFSTGDGISEKPSNQDTLDNLSPSAFKALKPKRGARPTTGTQHILRCSWVPNIERKWSPEKTHYRETGVQYQMGNNVAKRKLDIGWTTTFKMDSCVANAVRYRQSHYFHFFPPDCSISNLLFLTN